MLYKKYFFEKYFFKLQRHVSFCTLPHFSCIFLTYIPGFHSHLPEKVAAEDEAEHKDKEADAQHNDIHIEREVIDVRRHAAEVFRALRTQTTQASCQEFANTDYILGTHLAVKSNMLN